MSSLRFSVAVSVVVGLVGSLATASYGQGTRVISVGEIVDSFDSPVYRPPAFGGEMPAGYSSPSMIFKSGQSISSMGGRRTAPAEVWTIPAGKYGLRLQDGTRMIGTPAKGWSVKLKSSFGPVDIPLSQIARLAPGKDGQLSAHLKNGDRVSGIALSKELQYETRYGVLTIQCRDIARLDSANAAIKTAAVSASQKAGRRETLPATTGGVPRKSIRLFPGDAGGFGPAVPGK